MPISITVVDQVTLQATNSVSIADIGSDARHWDEPDRFDLGRTTSGHVGFGFGIHQCLGQMLARFEAEVVLEALIPRVAEFRLSGPIVRRLNNTLHAYERMPVVVS